MMSVDTDRLLFELTVLGEVDVKDMDAIMKGVLFLQDVLPAYRSMDELIQKRAWELYFLIDYQNHVAKDAKAKLDGAGQTEWLS